MNHGLMKNALYRKFIESGDTLWISHGGKRLFTSSKGVLFPLLEYMDSSPSLCQGVTIMDKVMGNAAALLSVKALAEEVWSPLGSNYAIETLRAYKIKFNITETVPFIRNRRGTSICPMEALSISGYKDPDEFFRVVRERYLSASSI